jgi:HPt (histidine-containing phosphotransfer) domain-containing protein
MNNEAKKSLTVLPDTVDLEVLNNLAEGQGDDEPDLVVELIDLYLEDTPRRIASMQEALANSDDRLLARAAHALKGSSSTLGANQVAESCAELEVLARAASLQESAVVLDRLEQELTSLRHIFLIERQKRSPSDEMPLVS